MNDFDSALEEVNHRKLSPDDPRLALVKPSRFKCFMQGIWHDTSWPLRMVFHMLARVWKKQVVEPRLREKQANKVFPELEVNFEEHFLKGSLVFPEPWMRAYGKTPDGTRVCEVGFGMSPLADRVYVDGLEVEKAFRRQGYATALLLQVSRYSGAPVPVTALRETYDATPFWDALRTYRPQGLSVTKDVRGPFDDERSRWRDVTQRKPPGVSTNTSTLKECGEPSIGRCEGLTSVAPSTNLVVRGEFNGRS